MVLSISSQTRHSNRLQIWKICRLVTMSAGKMRFPHLAAIISVDGHVSNLPGGISNAKIVQKLLSKVLGIPVAPSCHLRHISANIPAVFSLARTYPAFICHWSLCFRIILLVLGPSTCVGGNWNDTYDSLLGLYASYSLLLASWQSWVIQSLRAFRQAEFFGHSAVLWKLR